MSTERTIAHVFLDAWPGDHIRRTQERAKAAECQFFVHNDRVYSVTGEYWQDAPAIEADYLRGRLDIYERRREDKATAEAIADGLREAGR